MKKKERGEWMDETRLGGVNEPTETIGSLMQDCEELSQQISDERERLERFMLETGGASDASDRIQRNIDSLEETLAAAEGRLQALFDAQEREAFAPDKEAAEKQHTAGERASVIKELAERKAGTAERKPPMQKQERKSPGMDMGR
jgi:chromosome segregation ATPase